VRLAPHDERYRGFHAGMELAEGSLHADEKLTRRGYYDLLKSIDGWPEFNLFTAGYIFSRLPHTEARYADAVAYQWRNLDVCAQDKVDRRTAKYDQYMQAETTEGPKRVCWNSWIAPHNFEGFFLNMGDMIVKHGDPALARRIYANAKLSKTYEAWPFKSVLEKRIAQADENVARFRNPPPGEKIRTMMITSTFACAAVTSSDARTLTAKPPPDRETPAHHVDMRAQLIKLVGEILRDLRRPDTVIDAIEIAQPLCELLGRRALAETRLDFPKLAIPAKNPATHEPGIDRGRDPCCRYQQADQRNQHDRHSFQK
jgi:hypothetical protein